MGGGAIIDDSEPGSYADALRFVPWIEDRDGECWFNQAFLSPPTFQRLLNAAQQCPEAGCDHAAGTVCTFALCPGKRAAVSPFHATVTSPEARDDHA